jgi:hypothetical protein
MERFEENLSNRGFTMEKVVEMSVYFIEEKR